jgi:UDP-N-acetylglucosamine acyltransferase
MEILFQKEYYSLGWSQNRELVLKKKERIFYMSHIEIHPTAIIDSSASIGEGTIIGAYSVVGAHVRLGEGSFLHHHVTIEGPAKIGKENTFFPYSMIGQKTQDLKYQGEPTFLEIGDCNQFREFVTVHRSTLSEGATIIGSYNNFLAYSHIAHDCVVGDHVIFSNNGTLAGHVTVGNYAVVGGLSAVHQFCRIGEHAMIGGCTKIVQDVPTFMVADGNPAEVRGVNAIGLERRGFPTEEIRALREAYRILYRSEHNTAQALKVMEEKLGDFERVRELVTFISGTERGIVR